LQRSKRGGAHDWLAHATGRGKRKGEITQVGKVEIAFTFV